MTWSLSCLDHARKYERIPRLTQPNQTFTGEPRTCHHYIEGDRFSLEGSLWESFVLRYQLVVLKSGTAAVSSGPIPI